MIDPNHNRLSIRRQCELVSISRASFYRQPAGETPENLELTYIPMRRGFLYLVAIMDWFSRKVLAWRLSNTMDADFCVAALEEAITRHGKPDIFNTDQGTPSSPASPLRRH
jgi:transposase InsO family protein